jgi:deoxyribonuclease-4
MRLGKHVSISGGIDKAFTRAKELNCNCLQIFAKNPRGWRGRDVPAAEIDRVKQNKSEMDMNPLVVHSTYLVNIASPKTKLWEKSIDGLIDDYIRAGKLGAEYLVLHPGSHTGAGFEKGIENIYKALNIVFDKVENDTLILLENVAGAGTKIGSKFEELYDIISNVNQEQRLGICVDTCHAYSAGYNLVSREGIEEMLKNIENNVGLDRLKVIHINDSKHPLGSNKDEHAHIGDGFIGKEGFDLLINHPRLLNIPFILETPQFEEEDKDIELLWSLRKDKTGG